MMRCVKSRQSQVTCTRDSAAQPSSLITWRHIIAESGPSGPVGSLQHYCASVCLSVSSINAWASNSSLNGGSTWCPVQSFLSGPVRSWSPTPCQLESCGSPFTPIVYALALRSSISCQLWSPTLALCRVVWIVLFARARVSSVLV